MMVPGGFGKNICFADSVIGGHENHRCPGNHPIQGEMAADGTKDIGEFEFHRIHQTRSGVPEA